jgi:ABC-2 type transport system permease protein
MRLTLPLLSSVPLLGGSAISICRKELRRYFASPIGWVVLVASGLLFGVGVYVRDASLLLRPLALWTGFDPGSDFREHARITLLVALARTLTMCLLPLITMRLFIEERRTRTMEMLFTSPVSEWEIVLGKWAGALLLYVAILALSTLELACFRWADVDVALLSAAYTALLVEGACLIAIGLYLSALTRHETVAAANTLVVSVLLLRYCYTGILRPKDGAVCVALGTVSWLLTWRSVRALRWAW